MLYLRYEVYIGDLYDLIYTSDLRVTKHWNTRINDVSLIKIGNSDQTFYFKTCFEIVLFTHKLPKAQTLFFFFGGGGLYVNSHLRLL